MEIIPYILTISFFIKYRFKFPTDFFCFFCQIADKVIRSQCQKFGWFDISQFFIYDPKICPVKFSLKSSKCEIQHRKQMGQISHIGTGIVKICRL